MISISPTLIKPLIGIAAIAAIVFYVRHLQNELNNYKNNYEVEKTNHQAAANVLLSERISIREINEQALALEAKYNEITKKNQQYRDCINNRTCGVSLRQPTSKTGTVSGTNPTPSSAGNDTAGGIDYSIQQDIFSLEASISRDELTILTLQNYINTYCYKLN